MIINQYNTNVSTGGLFVGSVIANNGTTPMALVKAGPGVLKLGGTNTYSGGTYLDGGTIGLANPNGLGTGTLYVGPNCTFNPTLTNGNVGTSLPFLETTSLLGSNTIPNNIVLPTSLGSSTNGFLSMNISGGNTSNITTFSGVISGGNPNTILALNTKSSGDVSGTYILSGTNTFLLGGVDLGRGILELTSDASLGNDLTPMLLDSNNASPTTLVFLNSMNFNHPVSTGATGGNTTNINTSTNTVNWTNVLSGTSQLTEIGLGTLALSGANTWNASSFTLTSGTLALNSTTALGTSTPNLQISGGSLDNTSGGPITLVNNNPEKWIASSFTFVGSNSLNVGTGNITLSGNTTVQVNASTFTVGGAIAGLGIGINKTGPGTLALTGVSTFNGEMNVAGGTLSLGKTGSLAAGILGLNGGTVTTSAGYSTSQSFVFTNMNTGANTLSIANFSSGSLAFGLGTINRGEGSTLNITSIPATGTITTVIPNSTPTILGGWATVGGNTWAVSAGNNVSAGIITALSTFVTDYTAATSATDFDAISSGTFTPTGVNSMRFNTAAAVTSTLNGAFVINSGGILESAAVGNNPVTLSGGTSLTTGNGTDLIVFQNNPSSAMTISTPIVNGAGATTGLTKSGPGTLILNGSNTYGGPTAINAGTLVFSSDSAVSGGQVTVLYGATAVAGSAIDQTFINDFTSASTGVIALGANSSNGIDLSAGGANLPSVSLGAVGAYTLSGGLNPNGVTYRLGGGGGTLTVASSLGGGNNLLISGNGTTTGTVILAAANSYSGGSTNVSSGTLVFAAAGALPLDTGLTIAAGAEAIAATHASGLTGAAKNSVFASALTIAGTTNAWTGTLDLTNNDLDVQNGNLSTITNQVAEGYNRGNWNGSGGIVSSAAAADTTHLTALGVIQNSFNQSSGTTLYTSFDGQNVASSDVLVKYTYYGDTNLDGQVDGTDYSRIDNGYLNSLTGWINGDFNYDGVINGSDYTLIDNAYNTQGANIASEITGPSAIATAQIAGVTATSAVPEPTELGLLGMAGIRLLGRRRRAK